MNAYVYLANGKKLNVIHKSSIEKRTDYIGNMIYENGSLKRILVDDGYIENGVYHFYIQDHLGNNRIVAKSDGTVIQTSHYYPYGMSFVESTFADKQPYRYNGKELDTENGLNLYDYDARQMDVVFGRFTSINPMAEKYYSISPYVYCGNNPVDRVDPNGRDWYRAKNGQVNWTDYTAQEQMDENGIKGTYLGVVHIVFNGSRNEQSGQKNGKGKYIDGEDAVNASVTVYGTNGAEDIQNLTDYTMTSDPSKYIPIDEGFYQGSYMTPGKGGKLPSQWALNNTEGVPTMDNVPNTNPETEGYLNYNTPWKTGIYIHSTGKNGGLGTRNSTGCLLILDSDWQAFKDAMSGVKKYTVQVSRQQKISVPLQSVTGVVPNVYIPRIIIKRD